MVGLAVIMLPFARPLAIGIPLFQDISAWTKLLGTKTFQAGVVELHYQAVKPGPAEETL